MKEDFFRIRLSRVPESIQDELTELAFASGCSGLSEVLSYRQRDFEYEPEVLHTNFRDVDVFFQTEPPAHFLEEVRNLSPGIEVISHREEHRDWLHEWKKGFESFRLVGPYWVVPSWKESPPEAESPLYIDPGMAFGTGTHATTRLAASLILKRKRAEGNLVSALDVGTGTGILAMICAKEGLSQVDGVEIDPEARRTARENMRLNNLVNRVQVLDASLDELKEPYDLLIANIIDGVLLDLKEQFIRLLKPGGGLIFSGILEEREDRFLERFLSGTRLRVERRLQSEGWVGLWLRDQGASR